MVIFVNDDRAYLHWITHHRQGYVLDGKWRPHVGHLVLHRATCPRVKKAATKRTHWTTTGRLKACDLDREELVKWGQEQSNTVASLCEVCLNPLVSEAETSTAPRSRLESNILDYVLDTAVIHMDHEYPPYRLAVADIAHCMDKTPGQLASTLTHLIDNGWLQRESRYAHNPTLSPRHLIFPTMQTLRTLPAFQDESPLAIEAELRKLTAPHES